MTRSKRHSVTSTEDGGTDSARFEVGNNLSLWASASGLAVYWNFTVSSLGATGVAITSATGHGGTTNYTRTITGGTAVTLTAPSTSGGHNFSSWTGCDSVTTTTTCNLTMNATRTVTVNYAAPTFTLATTISGTGTVTSSPAGINCGTGTCSATFTQGTSVTLTATPGTNWTFAGWSGEGCTGTGTCVVSMTQARSVTATFSQIMHNLSTTVSGTGTVTGTGINCPGDCSETFNQGTSVTLTATPGTNWTFAGWSGEGCTGTGTCVVSMTQARSVTATFNQITHNLAVTISGTGTVTSSPAGINCGTGTCSATFAQGTSVTLTATPGTNWTFAGWSGEGCTGTGTCVVSMTQARSVTATFNQIMHALTVNSSGITGVAITGAVSEHDGTTNYTRSIISGTAVALTAPSAATGGVFSSWTGCDSVSGTGNRTCNITMNTARTVTANYISGLVGYWRFDEGTGTVANDASGSGNHGTLQNGPAWVAGRVGGALSFDGVNDRVDTLLTPSTELGQEVTMEAWIRLNAQGNHAGIMGGHGGTFQGVVIQFNNGWHVAFGDGSAWRLNTNLGNLPLNTWTHIVGVVRGGANGFIRVYRDGVEITPQTNITTNISHHPSFWIGRAHDATDRHFNGLIDEVRIFNRALSAAEIQALHNSHTLTVNLSGVTGVAITGAISEHSGTTDYTRSITSGTAVALTAPATSGVQNFINWTGCDSVSGAGNRTCNLTLNTARTVTANYTSFHTLDVGGHHSLAIRTDGSLWAWGWNAEGQLGLGDTANRSSPTRIGTDTDWRQIAAGSRHNLAIKTDGSLWVWGRNLEGQLGLGDTAQRNSPTRVGTDTNWRQVATGSHGQHNLAIRTDGSLWAWGWNAEGQLGLGDTAQRNSPTRVGTDTNWRQVAIGVWHTLATRTDSSLWAWGRNLEGQLGLGDTAQRNSPTRVGTDTNWRQISASINHSQAIRIDDSLWAWGLNSSGQLGLGDTAQRNSPTRVGTDTNWRQVAAGRSYALATRTDGSLWAWGLNSSGQLGLGDTAQRNSPTRVGTDTNWRQVLTNINHILATRTDSSLWAWGENEFSQLGLGDITDRLIPTRVGTDTNW